MRAEIAAEAEETYRLEQRFRYTYASPVRRLRHRLIVVPPAVHGGQRRLDHGLTVSGGPVLVSTTSDEFANHVIDLRANTVYSWIEFEAWAVVDRSHVTGATTVPAGLASDHRLLAPTPLTSVDQHLAEAVRALLASADSRRPLEVAERACHWAYGALTYEFGITGVNTSAAEAVAGGRGVCQDYAHVMLALCRAAGVAARYVSGHLVGEGGSHAWVEVVVPTGPGRAEAVAFDPTHDRRAGIGYVTIAVGRDYVDVAPTSGSFEGLDPGVLSATKRLIAG